MPFCNAQLLHWQSAAGRPDEPPGPRAGPLDASLWSGLGGEQDFAGPWQDPSSADRFPACVSRGVNRPGTSLTLPGARINHLRPGTYTPTRLWGSLKGGRNRAKLSLAQVLCELITGLLCTGMFKMISNGSFSLAEGMTAVGGCRAVEMNVKTLTRILGANWAPGAWCYNSGDFDATACLGQVCGSGLLTLHLLCPSLHFGLSRSIYRLD